MDWLYWLEEQPKTWYVPPWKKPLDPYAPDPPWMVRAREEVERQERTPFKIFPETWHNHRLADYAWYVVHLAQAVNRELDNQAVAREVRVLRSHKKANDWIVRIAIDFDLPRPFTIEGWVDHGDFRTPPFFREFEVSFITKNYTFLPGELTEKNGELVAEGDWCIVLNEWSARSARDEQLKIDNGEWTTKASTGDIGGKEDSSDSKGPGLLDLLHKFIPPPLWWRGYCSPFKIPYSLWYAAGPLPEWAEKRLYHPKSTEWPWLPNGKVRERMKTRASRKWMNRKGWWKDGVNRRVTRPSITDVRSAGGIWRKPYSKSAKKIHRKKFAWRRGLTVPGSRREVAAFCEAGPFALPATAANGETAPSGMREVGNGKGLVSLGPWPRWKVRRLVKGKPIKLAKKAVDINQVLFRYWRAMPSLTIAPLKARARRYRVQARLIPLGQNIHLAELFEFEAELQRALKHYSRQWCQMPKTNRVAMRDKVRKKK